MKKLLAVLTLVWMTACATVTVPPPPPPPPAARYIHFNVRGEDNKIPAGAVVVLTDDHNHSFGPCPIVEDMALCDIDESIPYGDPAHPDAQLEGGNILVTAPEYDNAVGRFAFNGLSQDLPDVRMVLSFHPLVQLRAEGQHFRKVNGDRFTVIGSTDFNLLGRWLQEGPQSIEPVLAQRAGEGFNVVRVFTAFNVCPPGCAGQNIGRVIPAEYPDFYQRLPQFVHAVNKHGIYVEFVAFTSTSIFHEDMNAVVAHWNNLNASMRGETGVMIEVINEGDHPANCCLPFDRILRPTGQTYLVSHGSGTQDNPGMLPYWDYATFHPAPNEWWRKAGHNSMELWAGPSVANENVRFPDSDNVPAHAYDAAAGCSLLSAGCTYHSVHGKNSTLWDGNELAAARAWGQGARSVPLRCQDGGYIHRQDLESPGILRAYQRDGDPACVVLIRN